MTNTLEILWHRKLSRRGTLALVTATFAATVAPSDLREARAATPTGGPGTVYFPVTGHNVAGDFLQFWHDNGALERLGYPVSEEVTEGARVKQYFERGTIEYTPGSGMTFGRLGAEAANGRHERAFRPLTREEFGSDRDDRRFFPEIGHSVSGTFAKYWSANGGIGVFGYPVSEPLAETVGEKNSFIPVQYFERGRMELWGDQVRVANLGREYVERKALGVGAMPKAGGGR